MRSSSKLLVSSLLIMLFVVACPKKAPPPPPPPPAPSMVKVLLKSDANLNPDKNGTPNSVDVRVYQLKRKDGFERATSNTLWNQEKETLGDDLVDRQQKRLLPSYEIPLEFQRNPQVMFLGVAADFRESPGDSWKKVIPLQPAQNQNPQVITLFFKGQTVEQR